MFITEKPESKNAEGGEEKTENKDKKVDGTLDTQNGGGDSEKTPVSQSDTVLQGRLPRFFTLDWIRPWGQVES